jgi:hypothetical protein
MNPDLLSTTISDAVAHAQNAKDRQHFQDVLAQVQYRDWTFHVGEKAPGAFFLQVRFRGPCAVSGQVQDQHGRKWELSRHMTTSEVVTTALKAVLTAEEHEAREHFRYRGQQIGSPHLDVDMIATLLGWMGANALDGREAP